jgi:hypothetical protein
MNTLISDLRFGLRMLFKTPAVTFIAVLALTLGHRRQHCNLYSRQRRHTRDVAICQPGRTCDRLGKT